MAQSWSGWEKFCCARASAARGRIDRRVAPFQDALALIGGRQGGAAVGKLHPVRPRAPPRRSDLLFASLPPAMPCVRSWVAVLPE